MAKHACSATFLQNVQDAKGKRLSCKRGNVWIMHVKLASLGKLTELSQRFNGMARLDCPNLHYSLLPWYYTDNLSSRTREEVNCLHIAPSPIAGMLLCSNGTRHSTVSAQKVRQGRQVPGQKLVKVSSVWFKEDSWHGKVFGSPRCCNLCFRMESPGSRCWPSHKTRTAKESGSGGLMKEEIFVLKEFCYLPDLVTLMLGSISPHTQHCHAQWHFEPSLGLWCMIAR